MASTRIQEKISQLVASQLPEFIRSDFTTFTAFLEAYYRFLEQDQGALEIVQNALSYSDIDKTTDSFVEYFLKNYAKDIPYNVLVDKRFLIKKIKDLYESKGSELSFKLLFKLLYDARVEINYPYENVLIASDGNWEESVSVRVELVNGSVDNILERYLTLVKSNITYTAAILRVKFLSGSLYEIFFDHNSQPPFVDGDEVTVSNGSSNIFTGTVKSTTTRYSISSPGKGFRLGQIFNVNIAGAVDTVVQVAEVTSDGGISKLKFLSYGYNFNQSVEVNLNSDLSVATTTRAKSSKTLGFVETFSMYIGVSSSDPNRYFDSDYVSDTTPYSGTVLLSSGLTTTYPPGSDTVDQDEKIATIFFYLGTIGRYPGSYTSNKGFLSEPDIRLQDDQLYQPFAYQTVTDIDIAAFYDIVKKMIHPAGQQLFNNRTLSSDIDISANVAIEATSNVFTELYSSLEPFDSAVLTLNKTIQNQDTATVVDTNVLALTKPVEDEISLTDTIGFNVVTTQNDNTSAIDDTQLIAIGKLLDDIAAITDSANLLINLDINNIQSKVTLTENVTAFRDNYAEAGYFEELYAGDTTILL